MTLNDGTQVVVESHKFENGIVVNKESGSVDIFVDISEKGDVTSRPEIMSRGEFSGKSIAGDSIECSTMGCDYDKKRKDLAGLPGRIGEGVDIVDGILTPDGTDLIAAGLGPLGVILNRIRKGKKISEAASESRGGTKSAKPSLSAHKETLKKVHQEVGKLPKGKPGKFGSPQAGGSKKGYRLDPPHDGVAKGAPESKFHINWWDYTEGKRGKGGRSGAIPIED